MQASERPQLIFDARAKVNLQTMNPDERVAFLELVERVATTYEGWVKVEDLLPRLPVHIRQQLSKLVK
jgi:hypothetical protein